jgi:hypothetical protein
MFKKYLVVTPGGGPVPAATKPFKTMAEAWAALLAAAVKPVPVPKGKYVVLGVPKFPLAPEVLTTIEVG